MLPILQLTALSCQQELSYPSESPHGFNGGPFAVALMPDEEIRISAFPPPAGTMLAWPIQSYSVSIEAFAITH
jgi:hypothetical protein